MVKTEQEMQLQDIFHELEQSFKKLDKLKDEKKIQAMLKDITNKLKDAKILIKDFEREARTDGMPPRELADRKRELVTELNGYIAMKKNYGNMLDSRNQLLEGGAEGEPKPGVEGMTMQEMMTEGRGKIKDTEQTLTRAEKLVEDTIAVGQQTAATLGDQTQQLNKIVDDLGEIEFTMKKASKVIRDIGRGLMTDKCIGFLLFLVVGGIVALVVLKIVKPNQAAITSAVPTPTLNITAATSAVTGRRLMVSMMYAALQPPVYAAA